MNEQKTVTEATTDKTNDGGAVVGSTAGSVLIWHTMIERPSKEGCYLVNHQTRYVNVPWTNKVIPAWWDGKNWGCYGTTHELCNYVTHWMHLPESPNSVIGGKRESITQKIESLANG